MNVYATPEINLFLNSCTFELFNFYWLLYCTVQKLNGHK